MKIPEHKMQFTIEGFNETFEYLEGREKGGS